jgi:hypothetical protein
MSGPPSALFLSVLRRDRAAQSRMTVIAFHGRAPAHPDAGPLAPRRSRKDATADAPPINFFNSPHSGNFFILFGDSKQRFDTLDRAQQEALVKAGKTAETFFRSATKGLDDEMVNVFRKNDVEVVTLSAAEFDAWVKVAQQSSYEEFAREVPDGKRLIAQALAVE